MMYAYPKIWYIREKNSLFLSAGLLKSTKKNKNFIQQLVDFKLMMLYSNMSNAFMTLAIQKMYLLDQRRRKIRRK